MIFAIFMIFFITAINIFYIVGNAKVLSKAGASVGQIILAILFMPYMIYLFGKITGKKKLATAVIVLTIVSAIIACGFTIVYTVSIASQALQEVTTEQVDDGSSTEMDLENFDDSKVYGLLISYFAVYVILWGISLAASICTMILYFHIGKQFGASEGFCIGLVLLPAIFVPILGLSDGYYYYGESIG